MRSLFFIFAAVILMMFGCNGPTGPTSDNRKKAEHLSEQYYEQSVQNHDDAFDAQEKALKIAKESKIDFEVQTQVASVQAQSKIDPIKFPPNDAAAEIARIYALAAKKKADFATAQANFRKLRDKDAATNLAGARRINNSLNPSSPLPPVSTSQAVQLQTGITQSPTLIDLPPGETFPGR
jgi:hypothetical protein